MKTIIVILSLLFTSASFADGIDNKITRIRADYRCENSPGGGIAFSLPKTLKKKNAKARVWMTDIGQNDGLELQVTQFSVARCAGCFSFEALLGSSVLRGVVNQFELELVGVEGETVTPMLKATCVPVKK